MPENEFEKKISSEMQQLKLRPSENVWLRVEERIRKKKDRRIFIMIFLLAGLALLGYWQRDNLFGERQTGLAETGKPARPSTDAQEKSKSPGISQQSATPTQHDRENTAKTTESKKTTEDKPERNVSEPDHEKSIQNAVGIKKNKTV